MGIVNFRVGEQVTPGQTLFVLGNLDSLRVETTDLDEIDVVRVALGQRAAVVFDALPDRVLEGRVTRISPMAEPALAAFTIALFWNSTRSTRFCGGG